MTWTWNLFWHYAASSQFIYAAWTTIWLTFASMAGAIVIGLVLAGLHEAGNPLFRIVYFTYTTLIRGTPLLLQLVFAYTVLPLAGLKLGVTEAALLTLCINEGAYEAELIRSGLESIPVGQREAARVTGFGYWQAMGVLLVPQALRLVIPTIGNQINGMFKYTSLVSIISMSELFRVTQEVADATFQFLVIYSVAAAYYLAMTGVWTLIQHFIERAARVPGTQAARRSRPRLGWRSALSLKGSW
ncbi:MAG: amino acid ABC transporter permease [Acetobacteraceae bacterium]